MSTKRSAEQNKVDRSKVLDLIVDHGIDIFNRRLYLSSDVGEQMYDQVVKGLAILNQTANTDAITIHLHTGGGDLYSAMGIYDLIKSNKIPVDIICEAACMSAGTLILQAARERISRPNTQFMVHLGYESFSGEVGTARRISEHYKTFELQFLQIYADKMETTVQKLRKLFDRDTYMTAQTALELSLIDRVEG